MQGDKNMQALWIVGGVAVYLLPTFIREPSLLGVSMVAFFYAPNWALAVTYSAGADFLARKISALWSPLIYTALAIIGFVALVLYLRFGRAPFLFTDPERAMNFKYLILQPSGWVAIFFLIKNIRQWIQDRRALAS
jgi:hypothetical protein